ncbi:hypothetical protein ACQP00_11430 [Dactylosporangium sp. CS-047395]|uniref:hypothetical protein n=1 Tax=Dactylosporangium sp. CS-047395 TaxID=3239936 RepID=UPI003D8BA627
MPDRSAEPPVDLATVRADDALLDALARGERAVVDADVDVDAADALAGLFADWHADLSADLPPFTLDDDATVSLDSLPDVPELRAAAPVADLPDVPGPARRRRFGGSGERRPGSGLRRTFAAVAAGIVILAGLALGAERSGPNGPLWPLTQVLYPEQAHARAAEQAIAEAADAIAAGRFDDARRLLDTATGEANQVDNAGTRQRLLDQIADLRAQLPPAAPPAASSAPATAPQAPTTAPTEAAPTPGPTTGGGNPGGGATTGGGNGNGGGNGDGGGGGQVIPGLPTQIVPTNPLPLPTQILPTTIPGLPLPTGLG